MAPPNALVSAGVVAVRVDGFLMALRCDQAAVRAHALSGFVAGQVPSRPRSRSHFQH